MSASIKQHLEECIEQLRRGELTESRLRELGEAIGAENGHSQSLLYLQSNTSSVTERVIGMRMVQNGVVSDGPFDAADWPYKSVLEAMNDGWRVIRFPVQLPVGHTQDTHLSCEFILDKWG